MARPEPGWFPDPFDPARLRWWDGEQWTTHLHAAPRGPGYTASTRRAATPIPPPRRHRAATLTLFAAAGLLVGGAAATAGGVLALVPQSSDTVVAVGATTPTVSTVAPSASSLSGDAPAPLATPSALPTPTPVATTAARPTPIPKPAPPKAAGTVRVVAVVDGDTIKVRLGGSTERVRLIGLDAPEVRTGECYAQEAAVKMVALVQDQQVRLTRDPSQADRDRYGRLLRHVELADGRQVAKVLIASGFAEELTYDTAYAGQRAYRAAERDARDAGRGLWGSACRTPAPLLPPGGCVIKGNISSSGERIFHVPGQRYYEQTRISAEKGERWFCSPEQARDAGWRPSKV